MTGQNCPEAILGMKSKKCETLSLFFYLCCSMLTHDCHFRSERLKLDVFLPLIMELKCVRFCPLLIDWLASSYLSFLAIQAILILSFLLGCSLSKSYWSHFEGSKVIHCFAPFLIIQKNHLEP